MSDLHAAPLDDEPRTPMWLPALGAALFVGVGLWWAVLPTAPPIKADEAAAASAAPAVTTAPAAATAPPRPQPANNAPPAASAMPAGHPGMGGAPPNPAAEERMRRLRQQIGHPSPAGHP